MTANTYWIQYHQCAPNMQPQVGDKPYRVHGPEEMAIPYEEWKRYTIRDYSLKKETFLPPENMKEFLLKIHFNQES